MSEITTLVLPRVAGAFAGDASAVTAIELANRSIEISLPPIVKAAADSMAADATSATKVWTNPFSYPVFLERAVLSPGATLTAHAANYASVLVLVDDGADGSPAAAFTWATTTAGTGNWLADIVEAPSTIAAARTVVAGGNVFFQITKSGDGVVVPVSLITVVARKV